jgi:hypothetical protein
MGKFGSRFAVPTRFIKKKIKANLALVTKGVTNFKIYNLNLKFIHLKTEKYRDKSTSLSFAVCQIFHKKEVGKMIFI